MLTNCATRRNRQIPRKIKPIKVESRRNRNPTQTNNKIPSKEKANTRWPHW